MQILVGISFRGKSRISPRSVSGISSKFKQSFRKMRPNLTFRVFFKKNFFGFVGFRRTSLQNQFQAKLFELQLNTWSIITRPGTTRFKICSIWSKKANSLTFPSFLQKNPRRPDLFIFLSFCRFSSSSIPRRKRKSRQQHFLSRN